MVDIRSPAAPADAGLLTDLVTAVGPLARGRLGALEGEAFAARLEQVFDDLATPHAGRVLFAFIPNVQPVTTMTACAGVALGPRAGAAVGGIAALVSNGFLGQGPWTPWQMLGWGLVGVLGGGIRCRFVLSSSSDGETRCRFSG